MSSYIQNLGDNSDTIILPIVDHADASSLDIDGSSSSNDDDENAANNINNNNNNINVDGNDNNDNPPSTSTTTSTTKLRRIELGCCFIPVPIGILLESSIFNPYKRAIPYQILDESSSEGEYILNQMYNLKEPDNETVSPLLMFFCALVLPFCFQILLIYRNKRKYHHHRYHPHQHQHQQQQNNNDDDDNDDNEEIHKTICVYFMSIGLTQSLTNIAKLYCGYLRPIFYEMCQPNNKNEDSDEQQFQCEGNQERQSRLSFPSGHASFSVCGLLVFSYYLERIYGISHSSYNNMDKNINNNNNNNNNNTTTSSRRRRHLPIQLVRIVSIVCYTPMLLAFFICISRVHDNFHHPADVIGGALLGGSIATVVFNTWFP